MQASTGGAAARERSIGVRGTATALLCRPSAAARRFLAAAFSAFKVKVKVATNATTTAYKQQLYCCSSF